MRSVSLRCLAGCVAFLLPAAVALAGRYLDRSEFRDNAAYKALIPVVAFGSLALAMVIPTILVMRARMPLVYRLGLTIGVWLLLAVELYWVFFIVVVAH